MITQRLLLIVILLPAQCIIAAAQRITAQYERRRGRCALDKCYAYGSGARRRESVTEQQAQNSRPHAKHI